MTSEAKVNIVEANIDDTTGEILGYTMEKLFEEGALDVFYTPIYMKKNRPAFKLSVICKNEELEAINEVILKETSTIGLRIYKVNRECLDRKIETVNTRYGSAKVKISYNDEIVKVSPEYEYCRKLSLENKVSLKTIYDEVNIQYYKKK